jgi:NAD(P)-dependent dehydrogenase (short-subunit alcohol dehydrogenase family)
MDVRNKVAVVTGGSRGLGCGLVEALVDHGAIVKVVARGKADLDSVGARLGVETISADIADPEAAGRILSDHKPGILVLNAGAIPPTDSIDRIRWEDFSATWNIDVKAGLHWIQASLNLPLAPGSRILVGSSGAAQQGSPLSGGYGGAKRMLWLMAKYANGVAEQKKLGLRFQAILPLQMIAAGGVGKAGSEGYAANLGIEPDAFLARFGAPMAPRDYGEHIVRILEDAQYESAVALGVKGDTGITVLEGAAA